MLRPLSGEPAWLCAAESRTKIKRQQQETTTNKQQRLKVFLVASYAANAVLVKRGLLIVIIIINFAGKNNFSWMKQTTTTTNSTSFMKKQEQAVKMTASANGVSAIGTKPTLIEVSPMRFLIMDAPRQANLHLYIREMRKHHVVHVVRVCEPTYVGGELESAGICLHEMEYKDGTSPSPELIRSWLELVDKTFYGGNNNAGATSSDPPPCIAVHCVAGLGRAPVMVAIALIEFAGMDPVEAVSFLREKRRGAINEKQLLYLGEYKKMYKSGAGGAAGDACCVILWIMIVAVVGGVATAYASFVPPNHGKKSTRRNDHLFRNLTKFLNTARFIVGLSIVVVVIERSNLKLCHVTFVDKRLRQSRDT